MNDHDGSRGTSELMMGRLAPECPLNGEVLRLLFLGFDIYRCLRARGTRFGSR